MPFRIGLTQVDSLCAAGLARAEPDDLSPALHLKTQLAIDAGIAFLESRQAPDGSVGHSVGLAAQAQPRSMRKRSPGAPP